MTKEQTKARTLWRVMRLCARHMDRTHPRWWTDERIIESVQGSSIDDVTRCWKQLIQQRTGTE